MDTSRLPFSKGRPVALERQDRRTARKSADDAENTKVKARSGGRCEVYVKKFPDFREGLLVWWRCPRRAVHVHHLMGGIGVRGRGASAKASNKLHLCETCHREIHAHVLVPDGPHFRRLT